MKPEIIAIINKWKSKPNITIAECIAGMAKEVNEYHAMIRQVARVFPVFLN